MTSLDDQLYIRFRSDDYASFNQLFHRYYGRLCAYSFQIIQDKQAAEDLIQDLFVKLWADRHKLIIRDKVSSYLFKSAKNACLNYLRSKKQRTQMPVEYAADKVPEDDNEQLDEEFVSQLFECIEKLPERSRQVFMMNRIEEQKLSDISEQLGISVKTIKNQLWKSMIYLKSCLETKHVF